jgi:hypothetical protein
MGLNRNKGHSVGLFPKVRHSGSGFIFFVPFFAGWAEALTVAPGQKRFSALWPFALLPDHLFPHIPDL